MAAQCAGLAAPHTGVMRQVTARRAQGACALEDVGAQVFKGVAEPTGVFRVLRPSVVAGVPLLVGRDKEMGWLVRRWGQSQEGLGQVGLGVRQDPWARRGRRQGALGGSGGCVPEHTPCGMPLRHRET